MKRFKKAVALLLTLVMVFCVSSTGLTAFAATTKNVQTYEVYTAFGDSIPAGYGQPSYVRGKPSDITQPVTKETYLRWVGKYVGAKKIYNCSKIGTRSEDFRHVLDPSYPTDACSTRHLPTKTVNGETVVDEAACAKQRAGYTKAIKEADIITLNYGGNDVGQPIMATKDAIVSDLNLTEDLLDGDTDFEQMINIFQQYGNNAIYMTKFALLLTQAITAYQENFEYIVQYIHKVNPNAKLVVLGLLNPLSDLSIGDMNIGSLLNVVNDSSNEWMKSECKYRSYYTFVDVQGTETFLSVIGTDQFKLDPHPTPAGHKDIAKRIVAALPSKSSK